MDDTKPEIETTIHGDVENGFIVEMRDADRYVVHAGKHENEDGAKAAAKHQWDEGAPKAA